MKKLIAALLCVLIIVSSMCLSVSAVGETLEASFATPEVDGVIDNVWRKTARQKLKYVFQADGKDSDRASSTVYVSSLWDSDAIYFLIEIIDNDFTFGGEGKYDNDMLNIYIDEADLFDKTWQAGQNCISIVPNEGANARVLHGEVNLDTQIVCAEAGDTTRIIEIKYVPTQLKLWRGLNILVDFKYFDVTEEGKLAHTLVWSDELGEGEEDSSNWSYLKLGQASAVSGYQIAGLAALSIGQTLIEKYTFVDGSDGYSGEGADKIWDGDVGTKFCTGDFPQTSYARLDGEYYITGIIMATANDNANYDGRCPDEWEIQGSTDGKNWITLAEGDDNDLGDVNYTYFAKAVEPKETAFKFVRFVNERSEAGLCQLSEVMVCGVKSTASQEEIDAIFNPQEAASVDENAVKIMKIVGAYDNIYSDDIADPNAPSNGLSNISATSTAIITIIVSTVFLLGLCALIVVLQSKKAKK